MHLQRSGLIKVTLLQLATGLFSQVLIHGISDYIGWATTTVTHVGLKPISFDAISITFLDRPFVKGSARFLVVWIYSNAITPEFLIFLTDANLLFIRLDDFILSFELLTLTIIV